MKAEDLMRYDWVCLECDNTPRQVDWIKGGEVGLFWNQTVTPPYLNPIPLTAEILEKNGFTRLGTSYILKGEQFGLDNPSSPSNYLDNYWLQISIKAVSIEYVHELQHALRLRRIDKTIKL